MRHENEHFFVGYLDTPPAVRRELLRWAAGAGLALLIAGSFLAAAQRDPGAGMWELGVTQTIDGIVVAAPYPMLRAIDPRHPQEVRTLLLVSEGKFGASERMKGWDGHTVRIRGTLLDRDGRSLLELADEPDAIQSGDLKPEQMMSLRSARSQDAGIVTLRGEIIDPKCYIGAMKPGGGKTHKACAQLCLSGGIPPMLVTRTSSGAETYYLLVNRNGGPVQQAILSYVGDPIELTGRLTRLGDLLILSIDASSIVRL